MRSEMDSRMLGGATEEGLDDRAVAFAMLAERQLDEAYRVARLIVGDPTEAADATHDAFVAAWRGWPGLRDRSRLDAWFGRILVNTCRNHVRRLRRRSVVDIGEALATPDPVRSPQLAVDDRSELEPAFLRLTPDQREVLVLRYYLDLPVDQIAARLGIPSGTVKSRIHNALRALETGLGPRHGEDGR